MCVITEKKTATKHRQAMFHNFLSLVVFWLGGGRAPWAPPPPPGYAYASHLR